MRIYLDTADKKEIAELMQWGAFAGITTNPVILKNSSLAPEQAIKELAPLFDGDFFVQTWGNDSNQLTENALKISSKLGKRAIIKVPITEGGLKTIRALSAKGVRTAATALFTPGQAMLAVEAGADIVIPFYNRMEEAGQNPVKTIELVCQACKGKTRVIVASLKKVEQIYNLPPLDVYGMTISPALVRELVKSPLTDNVLRIFGEASDTLEE